MSHRVLMFSYAYPPMGSPGALRVSKFAKYLPTFGWLPTVVTPESGYSRMANLNAEEKLPQVSVWRTGDFGGVKQAAARADSAAHGRGGIASKLAAVARAVMIPDRDITWYPFGYRAGKEAVRKVAPHALFSSSPTITNHVIAMRLARQTGLPWVADFRDLWTLFEGYPHSGLRARIDRSIEEKILRFASRILLVSQGSYEVLVEAWPEYASKMTVIRNGYDPDDFEGLQGEVPRDKYILAYAGMFYGAGRDPRPLFQALDRLRKEGVLTPASFRLDIIGQPEPFVAEWVSSMGVSDLVHFVGPLSYPDAMQRLASATTSLLLTHTGLHSHGEMPTKFFDYLAVGRPILVLAPPEFEVSTLAREAGIGHVIDPRDGDAIHAWLASEMLKMRGPGQPLSQRVQGAQRFSRVESARLLAEALDDIVAPDAAVNRA